MTTFPTLRSIGAAGLLTLLAGCATTPPPPPPKPAPAPPPAPAPAPPAPPADLAWADLPLSPGNWHYAGDATGSSARFGTQPEAPALTLRCDKATRTIRFALAGAASGPLTITTSYTARDLPLTAGGASLPANDSLLDRIAFSRGRVSYAVPGRAMLIVPAWAEPARVIEDCRS